MRHIYMGKSFEVEAYRILQGYKVTRNLIPGGDLPVFNTRLPIFVQSNVMSPIISNLLSAIFESGLWSHWEESNEDYLVYLSVMEAFIFSASKGKESADILRLKKQLIRALSAGNFAPIARPKDVPIVRLRPVSDVSQLRSLLELSLCEL